MSDKIAKNPTYTYNSALTHLEGNSSSRNWAYYKRVVRSHFTIWIKAKYFLNAFGE